MPSETGAGGPSILFICLGNTCRSPTAEGLFRHHLRGSGLTGRFAHDSAALGPWHVGNPPNAQAVRTAGSHGVELGDLISRQITERDFHEFDLIIGMDHQNMTGLAEIAPDEARARCVMLVPFALGREEIVPDPYGEGEDAYEATYRLIAEAVPALIDRLPAER